MKTFTITITDTDIALLKDNLIDIQLWLEGAVRGKTNNCWNRFKKEWTQKLMDDPNIESIPANKEGLVKAVLTRNDYKNKLEKEEEPTI